MTGVHGEWRNRCTWYTPALYRLRSITFLKYVGSRILNNHLSRPGVATSLQYILFGTVYYVTVVKFLDTHAATCKYQSQYVNSLQEYAASQKQSYQSGEFQREALPASDNWYYTVPGITTSFEKATVGVYYPHRPRDYLAHGCPSCVLVTGAFTFSMIKTAVL